MEDYKFLFKVVLIGNAGVGKTCLVRRFTQGVFPPGQGATIGVDFMIKTVVVDNEKIKVGIFELICAKFQKNLLCFLMFQLQIWDTAGQERFRSITQRYALTLKKIEQRMCNFILKILFVFSYYRSAHALILVYDISCQPTFDCLPDWLREIQEYANSKVLKILVGNKTDRDDREIPTAIGEDFAKQQGMYFLETSAKEADNVERLFYEIAAELIEQARTKEVNISIASQCTLLLQALVINIDFCIFTANST